MASIGHIAVGLLVGRAYEARSTRERVVTMAAFGSMGLLPDADALLVAIGSEYGGTFGHRGFSHSLLFAGVIAALVFVLARRWGTRPGFTALLAFMAVASHGLMDAMTYRTRGIPFLWPFTEERFTLPWRPIPPAPFGGHFVSQRGLDVMAIEMIYFLPLTMVALGPSLSSLRRLGARLAGLVRRTGAALEAKLTPPAPVPVPVRSDVSHRRAAARVIGILLVFATSLAIAQTTLRDSRAVAWLESAHDQQIAVSLQRTPRFQHLH